MYTAPGKKPALDEVSASVDVLEEMYSLACTEEESRDHKAGEVLNNTSEGHDDTPGHH